MQPNINLSPSPSTSHPLVEMSVLSPEWLRRSSMRFDSQPRSQPPISANGHDLFAGLGAVECRRGRYWQDHLHVCQVTGRRVAEGELQGNRWDVMGSIIPPWPNRSKVLCKMIIRWLWLDEEQVMIWISSHVMSGRTTFSPMLTH